MNGTVVIASLLLCSAFVQAHRQVTLTCGEEHGVAESLPGPPGKRGPEGLKGVKGEQGLKGDVGETCVELERKVEELEDALTIAEEKIENLRPPRSCVDILRRSNTSGVYTLQPFKKNYAKQLDVYCDHDAGDGGWMVFQRRFNGSVNFLRNWNDYRNGFGDVSGEYWLGLENIHQIVTKQGVEFMLRIDLEDFENQHGYAHYGEFSIGNETTNYLLHISEYNGTAGDSLKYHNGSMFSTTDRDNDINPGTCASHGPWWHRNCYNSNLNGEYLEGLVKSWSASSWKHFRGHKYSLKSISMKIKPK